MEAHQHSNAAIHATSNHDHKCFAKRLVFKPSLDLATIDNREDMKRYVEESARYAQAELACSVYILTSDRLLKAHSGAEDVFDTEEGDAVKPPTPVKLQLETNAQSILRLVDARICPNVGGQGGNTNTITGTLEAHVNGFWYKTSSAHPSIDVMYENIKCAFYRVGDHHLLPFLHFHLHNQIMLGTKETDCIKFYLENNDRNTDLQDFADKVDDLWDSKPITVCLFESPEHEIHGVYPTKAPAHFALTLFFLVELVEETNPIVISLDEIEIVNLAKLRADELDMTVVFKDFRRKVLQINSIPLESLAGIKGCLNFGSVKYYVNERELDWNNVVKEFRESPQKFIQDGGWESLNLEAGDACDCYYWEDDDGDLDKEEW